MSNSSPIVTKKTLSLSALAAVGACAACCAVPLLAAAGIGGGLTSALAGIRPGADLALAALAGVSVMGVMALGKRGRRDAACGTASEGSGGCGCDPRGDGTILSTPSPRPGEPVVCTADLDDKPTVQGQLDGYRAAFRHLLRIEKFEGGVRWVFAKREGLDAELRQLAQNEHQCCSFFKFDLRSVGDTVVWETRANAGAYAVLEEFARLPERLAAHPSGSESAPIKSAIEQAGLRFSADATAPK